jgi:hypothetical protein
MNMDQEEINEINKSIPYEEGKIYWKENYGWTSALWERLSGMGWVEEPAEEDPDIVVVKEECGNIFLKAADKIVMLRQLVYKIFVGF